MRVKIGSQIRSHQGYLWRVTHIDQRDGSPAVVVWVIGGPSATAGVSQTVDIAVPEGMEFAAGTGVGVSMVGLGATQTAAAVGFGQISIEGYEY